MTLTGQDAPGAAISSRRVRGRTALTLGCFAMAWFAWGGAEASSALSVALTVGSAAALVVAFIGAIAMLRRAPDEGALQCGEASPPRLGRVIAIEFALIGLGALAFGAADAAAFIPVWVCAIVGLHFFALATNVGAPALRLMGAAVTAVAGAALLVGLLSDVAPTQRDRPRRRTGAARVRDAGARRPRVEHERTSRLQAAWAMRAAWLIALLLTLGAPTTDAAAADADRIVERPDLQREFEMRGTVGTMVVKQSGRLRRTVIVGEPRSHARYLPSSTFKIPNSLIAIDEGIAAGADQPYPGPNPNYIVAGSPFLPAVCEGDLTLRSAFRNSCIPIYQRIARQVGAATYHSAVHALHYGNRRVRAAPVDSFWLEGPFAISAREQVAFLERLRRDQLPVSRRAMNAVRSMMIVDEGSGFVLRAKTGYVFSTTPARGWWVGWVQRPGGVSTFALNLDISTPAQAAARVEIGTRILTALDAFE